MVRVSNRDYGEGRARLTSGAVSFTYVPGHNHITGSNGWRPVDIPGFDPVSGTMAIHDMVEHFPGRLSGPANEYLAQGAMLLIRYLGGFFGDPRNVETFANEVVPPAFGMLFSHIVEKALPTTPHPIDAGHTSPLDAQAEMAIAELIRRSRIHISSKFAGQADQLHSSLRWAPGYMRMGFRLAEKRYPHLLDQGRRREFCEAWKEAAAVIDRAAANLPANAIKQDDGRHVLTVRVDTRKGTIGVSYETRHGTERPSLTASAVRQRPARKTVFARDLANSEIPGLPDGTIVVLEDGTRTEVRTGFSTPREVRAFVGTEGWWVRKDGYIHTPPTKKERLWPIDDAAIYSVIPDDILLVSPPREELGAQDDRDQKIRESPGFIRFDTIDGHRAAVFRPDVKITVPEQATFAMWEKHRDRFWNLPHSKDNRYSTLSESDGLALGAPRSSELVARWYWPV